MSNGSLPPPPNVVKVPVGILPPPVVKNPSANNVAKIPIAKIAKVPAPLQSPPTMQNGNLSPAELQRENQQLREENERLKQEIARLQYELSQRN